MRSCTSIGWHDCYPIGRERLSTIELALAQSGTTVTGVMYFSGAHEVNGTVSGNTLVLHGSREELSLGSKTVSTILDWTVTRDNIGMLQGDFRFKHQFLTDSGAENSTTYDRIELWSVILR